MISPVVPYFPPLVSHLVDGLRPEQQRVRVLALAAVHQAQGAEGRTSGLGLAGGLDVGQALGCGGEGGKGHEDVWQALWCGGRGAGGTVEGGRSCGHRTDLVGVPVREDT